MGIEWCELTEREDAELKECFQGPNPNMRDFIRFPKQNVLFPRTGLKIMDDLQNFPLKEDDIWIVTFPKCGTTWMQETISMLVNDVDQEYGKIPVSVRSPFLDLDAIMFGGPDNKPGGISAKYLKIDPNSSEETQTRMKLLMEGGNIHLARNMSGRRVLKTHFPPQFLPQDLTKKQKAKVVFVARTPMDCCVSFYHFMNKMNGYVGSLSKFTEQFMVGFNLFGNYWTHLLSGWELRDEPNFKFIWFEDMKKDTKKVITELSEFLEHPLSEEKIDALVHHVSFDVMKKNPAANPTGDSNFLRKGKVGDGKSHFTEKETAKFEAWVQENLKKTGIILPTI